jgi:serine/threonine protein kinase
MADLAAVPALPDRYRPWPDAESAALGSGGAATVWRVQDQALGVLVALKVLKSTNPGFLDRLEREAVLASRVVHPHVVGIHDVGRTPEGRGYLAFALASDGTMLDLATRPPAWPELMELIIQLLEALGALHARGILHLDVKLSNLLLHRSGPRTRELWLADLGVARALWGEDDHDKSVVGTVSYMASERLTGQHHLWCPATDLFAVGAVVYRLLTGRLPFPARVPQEAMNQRQRPPTTIRARRGMVLPPGIEEVVLPMLAFDRRARFDKCADVIRALRALPEVAEDAPAPELLGRSGLSSWSDLHSRAQRLGNPGGRQPDPPELGVPPWFRPPRLEVPAQLERPRIRWRVPQAPSLLVHREIQLVGRDPEFELLWRAARTAMRKDRPVLLEITGPPGSGRTRLVQEFTRSLEEAGLGEGVRMEYDVRGGADPGLQGAWRRELPPGSRPEYYLHEIASSFARDRQCPLEDCSADARQLAAFLQPKDGARPPNRAPLRAMLVEHLQRRSWRGLSWLWVEDADLAGENDDCWAIIDEVLTRGAPILVLVTTRGDRITPSLMELRARHHRSVRSIDLEALPTRVADELVQAHLPVKSSLAARLAQHAGGNPKAIKDLLAHWVQIGCLEEVAAEGEGRLWDLQADAPPLPADQRAFAEARLEAAKLDADAMRALEALAFSGSGSPERVIARVAPSGVDRLLISGLADLRQGALVLQPPELVEVLVDRQTDAEALRQLHAALADAWAAEPESPEVWRRTGRHRASAGQTVESLPPLARALYVLAPVLPVPELDDLAHLTLQAARAAALVPQLRASALTAWLNAALCLADCRWRRGDAEGAAKLDAAVAAAKLAPRDALRALCARVRRGDRDLERAWDELAEGRALLAEVPPPARAEFYTTLALLRTRRLETEAALADLLDALACRPEPLTECRARLLRARLLASADPMIAWHEAMRVIEVARDHGLLRMELLAWGLAGEDMVFLGRGEEAIERQRTGVARLLVHGEGRAAVEARLHLGTTLRAAGRDRLAVQVWRAAVDGNLPGEGTAALGARVNLALLAALAADGEALLRMVPARPPADPAHGVAWALLEPLGALLAPDEAPLVLPTPEQGARAVELGASGLFLVRALCGVLADSGEPAHADCAHALLAALQSECARRGLDADAAAGLLERFERAQG